jgi:hypothetical protein
MPGTFKADRTLLPSPSDEESGSFNQTLKMSLKANNMITQHLYQQFVSKPGGPSVGFSR